MKDIEDTQNVKLNFPIIADSNQKVANLYSMIQSEDNKMTVRSVFIIAPEKELRLTITYPAATPANWRDGDDVIVLPAVSNEEADELFPKGYEVVRPYLRTTPQPNK